MPSLVERKQTPIGPIAFARGVIEAWETLYGEVPSKETIGVLWGQYMIETGGAAVWNYNVGNVKHVSGDGYDWIDLPGTWEIVNGQKVTLPEGDPGRLFRAYDSFSHAFKSHLAFLKKRYGLAWTNLVDGKPREFAYNLKKQGYYTGPEDIYANVVEARFRDFVRGTYYDDALKQLSIVLGNVGKPSPSASAPVLPGEQSPSDSGVHTTGSNPVVDWDIVHKSPFDEEK